MRPEQQRRGGAMDPDGGDSPAKHDGGPKGVGLRQDLTLRLQGTMANLMVASPGTFNGRTVVVDGGRRKSTRRRLRWTEDGELGHGKERERVGYLRGGSAMLLNDSLSTGMRRMRGTTAAVTDRGRSDGAAQGKLL